MDGSHRAVRERLGVELRSAQGRAVVPETDRILGDPMRSPTCDRDLHTERAGCRASRPVGRASLAAAQQQGDAVTFTVRETITSDRPSPLAPPVATRLTARSIAIRSSGTRKLPYRSPSSFALRRLRCEINAWVSINCA